MKTKPEYENRHEKELIKIEAAIGDGKVLIDKDSKYAEDFIERILRPAGYKRGDEVNVDGKNYIEFISPINNEAEKKAIDG